MKRLLVILIILFPIVTLVIWVYLGMARSGKLPAAPNSPAMLQTNSNSAPALH